jgi:hypothetical protein
MPFTSAPAPGQGFKKPKRPDFIPADYDDYRHMLDRLGTKKMRPGRGSRTWAALAGVGARRWVRRLAIHAPLAAVARVPRDVAVVGGGERLGGADGGDDGV